MSLLEPPHCPNCNSGIDLTELWRAAPRSGNTMIGRVGVVCTVCGVKLRVLQGRAYMTGWMVFVTLIALMAVSYLVAPVTRSSVEYKIRMGVFIVAVWGATVLHKRRIPTLLTVRLIQDGEIVQYPLARPAVAESEEDAEPQSALELNATKDDRPSWACPKCGEENPGNFDECWKCQTWRVPETNKSGDQSEKVE
jgi:hypothetical protein